jgi:outer membrane protein TolC
MLNNPLSTQTRQASPRQKRIQPIAVIATALFAASAAVCLPSALHAEGAERGAALKLAFREGAAMALRNSLDVMMERASVGAAAGGIDKEEGAFDPEASLSVAREDSTTPLSSRSSLAVGGLGSIESESYSMSAALAGKTSMGTEYSIEVSEEWTADTVSAYDYEYGSFAGIRLTQPLLKGFGVGVNRYGVNLAAKELEASEARLVRRALETVSEYGAAYWSLVKAIENLNVRLESLALAEELLGANRQRLEAGTGSALDVTLAEAAAASRKDIVIQAQKERRVRENALKTLISDDAYALMGREIAPDTGRPLDAVVKGLDESVREALSRRPDYMEARAEVDKLRMRIDYADSALLPAVDMEALWGLSGLGASFAGSFEGMDSNPQWSLGLAMSYPLGNTAARSELSIARIEEGRALINLRKVERGIILGIDGAIKSMEEDLLRVEAARASVRFARAALEAEEKKLAAGRSTTYNVLKVQEDLALARYSESTAASDYYISLISYHRERGTLLDVLGMEVEGPGPGDGGKGAPGATR